MIHLLTPRNRDRLFREIVRASQASTSQEDRLCAVASLLRTSLTLDACCIMLMDPIDGCLHSGGVSFKGGGSCSGWSMSALNGPVAQSLSEKSTVRFGKRAMASTASMPPHLLSFFTFGASVPVLRNDRPMGVLLLGLARRRFRVLGAGRLRLAQTVADLLSDLLRAVQSHLYAARKGDSLARLLRISSQLASLGDRDHCLYDATRAAAEVTGSSGAIFRMLEDGELAVKAFFSKDCGAGPPIEVPNDRSPAMAVHSSGRGHLTVLPDSIQGTGAGGPARDQLLGVPFRGINGESGVLTVYDRRTPDGLSRCPYTREERETLHALSRITAQALGLIEEKGKVRVMSEAVSRRMHELTLLHHISRSAMRSGDTAEALRTLMTAITHPEGLAFDRAFVFMYDRDRKCLRGVMGVEVLEGSRAVEKDSDTRELDGGPHRNLDAMIAGFSVVVNQQGGVLARTAMEKRPFRISLPRDQEMVCDDVIRFMGGVSSFATVPLLSDDRVLGVIWVDNLYSGRPVKTEDLHLLVSTAAQAGLAVERRLKSEALEALNSQILELQGRLIQWEKMAALGEMAATVAHEIRNPLVSIGGFTRRLTRLLPEKSQGRRYVEIVIREVDHLERTLENVMSFARSYGTLDRQPVLLTELLADCVDLFRENFKRKRLTLKKIIPSEMPPLMVDERQIKQAVINILFNAGEAAPERGSVMLQASMEGAADGNVRVSVTNNGQGIDPEDLKRIFEPFFTTKGAGTGLGLAIAQRVIMGHGGEIVVDNRQGEGVTFTMILPLRHVAIPPSGSKAGESGTDEDHSGR